jgi:hypothetical protein
VQYPDSLASFIVMAERGHGSSIEINMRDPDPYGNLSGTIQQIEKRTFLSSSFGDPCHFGEDLHS